MENGRGHLLLAAGGLESAKKLIDDFVAERATGSEYLNSLDSPQQMANQCASIKQKLAKKKKDGYNVKGSGYKYSEPKQL